MGAERVLSNVELRKLVWIPGKKNVADVLTKEALTKTRPLWKLMSTAQLYTSSLGRALVNPQTVTLECATTKERSTEDLNTAIYNSSFGGDGDKSTKINVLQNGAILEMVQSNANLVT